MTSFLPRVIAVSTVFLAAAAAVADDEPANLLERARQAVASHGPVEYRATLRAEGPMGQAFGTVPESTVVIGPPHGRAEIALPRPFVVQGTLERAGRRLPLGAAFDGTEIVALLPSDSKVWTQQLPSDDGLMMVESYELLLPGFGPGSLEPAEDAAVRDGGRVEVDGTPCHVVEIVETSELDGSGPGQPSAFELMRRIAFGVDDHLPRSHVMTVTPIFGETRGERSAIITEVKGGLRTPSRLPERWTIERPEGWDVVDPSSMRRGPQGLATGAEAPDWTLKDGAGAEHSLGDFAGKVVVLDFWATWCGPCKMAMPGLQKLHERFADDDVAVIGISAGERRGDPTKYMADKGFTYLGLIKGEDVAQRYGVSGIPHLFVIAPDGTVAHQSVGFSPRLEEELAGVIEGLLD